MKLISHADFAKLRLGKFIDDEVELESLKNWEFMGERWIGESFGFTEWLRPQNEPEVTRSISIYLEDFEPDFLAELFSKLGVNLVEGLKIDEIEAVLGKAKSRKSFAKDRLTYEFLVGSEEVYYISCTVLNQGGLVFFVMMNHPKTIQGLK